MKSVVSQFIPIILIVLLLSCSKTFVNFSYSILGKVVALLIIMFYTHLDKYVGLVICLLIIIYYQSDYVENMLNTDDIMNKLFENFESAKISNPKARETEHTVEEIQCGDNKTSQLQDNMSNLADVYPTKENDNSIDADEDEDEEDKDKEGFTTKAKFRKDNCRGKELVHKNMLVKQEMVSHVFPNVKMDKGECNICEKGCDFSIGDKLAHEKELFSKFSRDEK